MNPPPRENLLFITNQRAAVRVRFTTNKADITRLPKFESFPWDEVNITSAKDGHGKERSSHRHRLRVENQVEQTSVKGEVLKEQEFWKVSRDHLIRISRLGMTPRELSDSPSKLLDVPPPRIRPPPRGPEITIQEDELIVREPEERGEEFENLEITIRQTRKPVQAERSALERILPPRSRSSSTVRHQDRSRSRSRSRSARADRPTAASRRSRRSSPAPEHRNPSPPSPAPGTSSTPTSRNPRTPSRIFRPMFRPFRPAEPSGTLSRIEELENQIDSVLHAGERGEFDESAISQSIQMENRRLHQEDAAGSSEEEADPAEEWRKARLLGSFILHLVNKARHLRRQQPSL